MSGERIISRELLAALHTYAKLSYLCLEFYKISVTPYIQILPFYHCHQGGSLFLSFQSALLDYGFVGQPIFLVVAGVLPVATEAECSFVLILEQKESGFFPKVPTHFIPLIGPD